MMFLLIDQGNSRCKYLLTQELFGRGIITSEVRSWDNKNFDDETWRQYLSDLKQHEITQVLVSSVAGQERRNWFKDLCSEVLGVVPCFAISENTYLSPNHHKTLANSYQTPQALGVDRWLAMIGAFERVQGSFVVIDAGTAITSDWVDTDGNHKGGHIVAGEHLLQQTLLGNTGGIAWSAGHDKEAPDYANDIGQNTSAAVALGAKAMVRGYCHQVAALIARQFDSKGKGSQPPRLMVTGGNGDIITQWLKDSVSELRLESEVKYHPNLVLEGISYWFSLNN